MQINNRTYTILLGLVYFVCLGHHVVQAENYSLLKDLPRVQQRLKAGQPVNVVALGDSITTYYGNHSRNRRYYRVPLAVSYYGVFTNYLKLAFPKAQLSIINKGIGGETADRGLKRVERDVLSHNPDLVFVMYGANDGRAGRNIKHYQAELKEIITKIRRPGARNVDIKTIKSAWRQTPDGYTMEVAIPIKSFAATDWQPGSMIGFSLACD